MRWLMLLWLGSVLPALAGCAANGSAARLDAQAAEAVDAYRCVCAARVMKPSDWRQAECSARFGDGLVGGSDRVFTLGTFGEGPTTQPVDVGGAGRSLVPAGYWRRNVWHQMGYEARELGMREFWRGFKTSFWDTRNAAALVVTLGASVTLRETGVDDTVRNRTHGNRQLGDFDEPIQLLGNPATHFAGTGVLWLASALTRDAKQHEVAKSLTTALAVNGATTMVLKASTRTRAPNGDRLAWPSGHTSSAFTMAAVLNEHYGPWVGVPSLALAGLVGYQRIDSRVHDFSDVVFGAMLGYVVGSSIAQDGEARYPELFGMDVIPYVDPETGATGIALSTRW